MNLNYSINGVSFKSLGIVVADSDGIVDGLELKEPFSVDWPDANGEVVDLTRPRWQKREIKLDCFMVAPTADAFVSQWSALLTELIKPNTQRLRIDVVELKPLVYEVYIKGSLEVKKKWRTGKMFGQFTLNLIEPQPVKAVYWALGGNHIPIHITTTSPIHIYWGDGTSAIATPENHILAHDYPGNSSDYYYLIISGELQQMTIDFIANVQEIWPRLY